MQHTLRGLLIKLAKFESRLRSCGEESEGERKFVSQSEVRILTLTSSGLRLRKHIKLSSIVYYGEACPRASSRDEGRVRNASKLSTTSFHSIANLAASTADSTAVFSAKAPQKLSEREVWGDPCSRKVGLK